MVWCQWISSPICSLTDNHDIISVRVYDLDGLSVDQDATPSGTDSTQAVVRGYVCTRCY